LRISSSFCSRIKHMDLVNVLRISAVNYQSKSDTRELIRFLVQLPHFLRIWHLFFPLKKWKLVSLQIRADREIAVSVFLCNARGLGEGGEKIAILVLQTLQLIMRCLI